MVGLYKLDLELYSFPEPVADKDTEDGQPAAAATS